MESKTPNPTRYYIKETASIYESKLETIMLTNNEKTHVTIKQNLRNEIISAKVDNSKASYKERPGSVFNLYALGYKETTADKFLRALGIATQAATAPASQALPAAETEFNYYR